MDGWMCGWTDGRDVSRQRSTLARSNSMVGLAVNHQRGAVDHAVQWINSERCTRPARHGRNNDDDDGDGGGVSLWATRRCTFIY